MSKEYLEALDDLFDLVHSQENFEKGQKCYDIIKEALQKLDNIEETYVIYCVNNFHNIYMDYRGEPCNYEDATIFSNKFEAHKFLREKGTDDYYRWSVFNVKDLREDQKRRFEVF